MLYYFLVVWHAFVALSSAAIILGPPASEPHVVYASAVIFVAATASLIVSAVLAVRHRAAKWAAQASEADWPEDANVPAMQREVRPTGTAVARREIEGG
jgi:hypothetical protein